jgi:hypothetical protein
MQKVNWYPGSAMASAPWIQWLRTKFPASQWIYSDQNKDFLWACPQRSQQILMPTADGLHDQGFKHRVLGKVHCLVLSWHPGLKAPADVIHSGILQNVKPQVFVFDPGMNPGEIQHHLDPLAFENEGYVLARFQELPELQHSIAIFNRTKE